MLINEVEHIVGLSKKSIRYYEKNGLLSPERDGNNDYRIYKDSDIFILRKIKFLRDLGVPIRELKLLSNKELSLSECIRDRIKKIEKEEDKYKTVKEICEKIIVENKDYDEVDFAKLQVTVNILGKEGFTLREIKTNKTRKIVGAIFSSVVFSAFFIMLIILISYFQFTESEKIPWLIYTILTAIFSIPVLGIAYNLVIRIKEILGGEEDEASKY